MSRLTILVTAAGRAIGVRLARSGWRDVTRRVIHDFDDERAAAPPGNTPNCAKTLDLDTTVIIVGGREHTQRQFATLLDRSGFRIGRVIPRVSTTSLNSDVAGR